MESFFFDQMVIRDAVNSARLGVQLHVHWRSFMHALVGEGPQHDRILDTYKRYLVTLRPDGGENVWREGWHLDRSGMPQVTCLHTVAPLAHGAALGRVANPPRGVSGTVKRRRPQSQTHG
jgi:hypothetical protein